MPRSPRRSKINWVLVEAQYRAGTIPLVTIAAEHETSTGRIDAVARLNKWTRATPALTARLIAHAHLSHSTVYEDEVKQIAAEEHADAQVVLARLHQKHIAKYRALAMTLFEELKVQTLDQGIYEEVAKLLQEEELDDKAVDKMTSLLTKWGGLGSRITMFERLVGAVKTIIGMERESFGMTSSLDEAARRILDASSEAAVAAMSKGFIEIEDKFRSILKRDKPPSSKGETVQ